MNCKMTPLNKLLITIVGFFVALFINVLVQYNFPRYNKSIFDYQWQASIWVFIYLFFLFALIILTLYFIFGDKSKTDSIIKKPSYFRLIIVVPLFLLGAFLTSLNITDFRWNRIDPLIFGLFYLYSAYLIFIPLINKLTLSKNITDKHLILIAVGLCISVFIPPSILYFLPQSSSNIFITSLILSPYDNGYIFSLFAIAFAIGLNLKLERDSGHKIIFKALGVSCILVLLVITSRVMLRLSLYN